MRWALVENCRSLGGADFTVGSHGIASSCFQVTLIFPCDVQRVGAFRICMNIPDA